MVVSMACPSCGGQSTEYDLNKWTCLHCGNKFVFVPPSSPQTQNYVQNTVNVVGQPNYELDVGNAKPAKPIIKTRYEHSPDEFETLLPSLVENRKTYVEHCESGRKHKNSSQMEKTFWLLLVILFSFLTIVGVVTISWLMLLCIPPALFSLIIYFLSWEQTNEMSSNLKENELGLQFIERQLADQEQRKCEKIIVGYQPVCPYCMEKITVTSVGLTHCLKCGKQFHYSNECSYPLKLR